MCSGLREKTPWQVTIQEGYVYIYWVKCSHSWSYQSDIGDSPPPTTTQGRFWVVLCLYLSVKLINFLMDVRYLKFDFEFMQLWDLFSNWALLGLVNAISVVRWKGCKAEKAEKKMKYCAQYVLENRRSKTLSYTTNADKNENTTRPAPRKSCRKRVSRKLEKILSTICLKKYRRFVTIYVDCGKVQYMLEGSAYSAVDTNEFNCTIKCLEGLQNPA